MAGQQHGKRNRDRSEQQEQLQSLDADQDRVREVARSLGRCPVERVEEDRERVGYVQRIVVEDAIVLVLVLVS